MWIRKWGSEIYSVINFAAKGMDILGRVILVAMMLLTVADVFLRYFFNRPIVGGTEITEYMMACLMLSIPLTTLTGKAIKMDMVVERLPQRVQVVFDSITDAIGLVVMLCLAWQLFREMANAKEAGLTSTILRVPSYPFYGITAWAITVLSAVIFVNILKNLAKGVKR